MRNFNHYAVACIKFQKRLFAQGLNHRHLTSFRARTGITIDNRHDFQHKRALGRNKTVAGPEFVQLMEERSPLALVRKSLFSQYAIWT